MSLQPTINGQLVHDTFRAWNAEQDRIDSQLNESLDALAAYQSHLDEWHLQLAHEREVLQVALAQFECERDAFRAGQQELEESRKQFELDCAGSQASAADAAREREQLSATQKKLESEWSELRTARDHIEHDREAIRAERHQLDHDRDAVAKGQSEASASLMAELNAARDRVGALTTSLLDRTEELRTIDNRRAEAVTEMELARAREKELKTALEEQKQASEQERAHWKEELRQLRELLQKQMEASVSIERLAATDAYTSPAQPTGQSQPAAERPSRPVQRENPVLGSIVQQFDKLRQQRASDRQSGNKPR
jgi:chromosome segregation ATPase